MITTVAREGYAEATVAKAIEHAGVSRRTFYDLFEDKQDCFLAGYAQLHQGLLDAIGVAVRDGEPDRARESTVRAMLDMAASEPERARILFTEILAGGSAGLDARERALAGVAAIIEQADNSLPPDARTPDVATTVVIGAVQRLLSRRLRDQSSKLDGLAGELTSWLGACGWPRSEHRWSSLRPLTPERRRYAPAATMRPPERSDGSGSRRRQKAIIRERILFATAEAVKEKGYTATSIADIVKIAGTDHRAFSAMFDSKEDAYVALHQFGVRRATAATAAGFLSSGSWEDRAWEAGRAFNDFMDVNPLIAHIGFIESYAVGPRAVKPIEDALTSFTMFLREAQRFKRTDKPVSSVVIETISLNNFEMAHQQTLRGGGTQGLHPHSIFSAFSPFLGPDGANRLIDRQLEREAREDEHPVARRARQRLTRDRGGRP